jgi:hypothetical protein
MSGGSGSGGGMAVPSGWQTPSAPVMRRLRAYFAPVQRSSGVPAYFDPARAGAFNPSAPPAGWTDLGWIENFARKSSSTISALRSGAPAVVQSQVRQELEATVGFRFLSWGKLQLALAAGSEQMNLLATASGAVAAPSGGTAATAARTAAGSTSTIVQLTSAGNAGLAAGDIVAVDADYTTQTGYVGSGASAAYIPATGIPGGSVDYIRRVTLNVARVIATSGTTTTTLTLEAPLLGGAPSAGLGVQQVIGFVDREGGSFFQEWSALFAAQGEQGDWIFYHYPRLQAMQGAAETMVKLADPLQWVHLDAQFRALPVTDSNDGAQALCFRSYLPAPNNTV